MLMMMRSETREEKKLFKNLQVVQSIKVEVLTNQFEFELEESSVMWKIKRKNISNNGERIKNCSG